MNGPGFPCTYWTCCAQPPKSWAPRPAPDWQFTPRIMEVARTLADLSDAQGIAHSQSDLLPGLDHKWMGVM